VNNDARLRRDQLEKEINRAREAFDAEYRSISSAWGGKIGPFPVNITVSAQGITTAFIMFNLVCFAAGIAFTLQRGILQALGISLVVGGLFSVGTFTAQWWDHAWQRQNVALDRAFGDTKYVKLQQLGEEYRKLYEEFESLPEPSRQGGSPFEPPGLNLLPPSLPPSPKFTDYSPHEPEAQ
jgi:hypothetical protein